MIVCNNSGVLRKARSRESSIGAIVGLHYGSLKARLHGSFLIIILDESSKSERIIEASCCLDVSSEATPGAMRRSSADASPLLNPPHLYSS